MVGISSLHLSLWALSDLLEHYPLVVWGVFTGVVVVAVHREDVLGGGVVVLPLECEVYYHTGKSLPITMAGLSFHFVIIP